MLGAQLADLHQRWWQGLDLLGDVVDSSDETLVLEGHHVAVQADEEVDVPLPGLRLGPDAIDELSRGGDRYEHRIDVAPEALEDVLPDSLLLGDRAELAEVGRDLPHVLRRFRDRSACAGQPSEGDERADAPGSYEQIAPVQRVVPAGQPAAVVVSAHKGPSCAEMQRALPLGQPHADDVTFEPALRGCTRATFLRSVRRIPRSTRFVMRV